MEVRYGKMKNEEPLSVSDARLSSVLLSVGRPRLAHTGRTNDHRGGGDRVRNNTRTFA